jgi:hypothetical protein
MNVLDSGRRGSFNMGSLFENVDLTPFGASEVRK